MGRSLPTLTTEGATPDRRSFLKWVSAFAGACTALLAGVPSLVAFISPGLRRRGNASWVRVGDSAMFEWGVPRKVDFVLTTSDAWVESRTLGSVWIYTDDGEQFVAFDPRCTHLGCSFTYEEETGAFLCPCHVGRFDAKSGAVVSGPPPRGLDRLETRLDDDGTLYVSHHAT